MLVCHLKWGNPRCLSTPSESVWLKKQNKNKNKNKIIMIVTNIRSTLFVMDIGDTLMPYGPANKAHVCESAKFFFSLDLQILDRDTKYLCWLDNAVDDMTQFNPNFS